MGIALTTIRRPIPLVDTFCRQIDHLRISVTGACDLRCRYCRPRRLDGCPELPQNLSESQRVDFIRYLCGAHSLSSVRVTGGEPLLYPGLISFVEAIRKSCPELALAMTTNGRLLAQHAHALRAAGLDRLNVSLDSLDESRYRQITGGRLGQTIRGLDAARDAGFPPPKLNCVVLRGLNDESVTDLAAWAIARGSELRFLEAMPIGPAKAFNVAHFVSARAVRRRLSLRFTLTPTPSPAGSTATRFRATDGVHDGIVGTIAPVSEPFCSSCQRIRLTADGRLFPCLLDDFNVDIRPAWASGSLDSATLGEIVQNAARSKRAVGSTQNNEMIQLGG